MEKRLLYLNSSGFLKATIAFILTVFVFSNSFAQVKGIKGKVTDNVGPLPGVTVLIKGTQVAAVTDGKGNYTINAPENSTLVFRFVGLLTQEVVVGKTDRIDVKLVADNKQLQEIVVVGYGTTQRKDLTGSVGSVSAAQIEKTPVTTLDQAIQGRVAGVQVTNNDGAPGSGVQVQIRGIGTFGSNTPLYVVDGYPVTTGLGALNQNDIATIDILKDASATAIYGNRAANGVVIITTKKGRKDGVQVTFDALGSIQAEPKKYKLANAAEFAALAVERAGPDAFQALPEWSNPSSLNNVNWQDEIYQSGYKQNYNLGIRGGDEKVQAAFSAGWLDQKGIVLGSYFKRINAGLNVDYQPFKWLKSSTSFKYSRSDNKVSLGTGGQDAGTGIGTLAELIPTITGNPLTNKAKDSNGNYGFFTPNNQFISYFANPVYSIESQDQKNLSNYFLGTTNLEATIFEGFRIKTNLGINTNDYSGYYFTPSDDRTVPFGGAASQSFYSQSANNTYNYLWENTIAYTKTLGKHNFDFVGGVSMQKDVYRNLGIQGNGSLSNLLRSVGGITTITSSYGGETPSTLTSQFARLNYKFDDKYLITGTIRRDGSSRFAEGHQYGVFPSGSVAWRVKNESFLKESNVVSDLKFRASYGKVGNQDVGNFQYLSQYTNGGNVTASNNLGYPFGEGFTTTSPGIYQPGIALAFLPNPNLKWETTTATDIGMDASFLEGKLNLTIDYYKKESRDFLLSVPVPPQSGFTFASRNVGSIRNSGFEITLDYHEAKTAFKYGASFNITTINNKLLSLSDGLNAVGNFNNLGLSSIGGSNWTQFTRSTIGGPIGEFFGFRSAGIFQSQAEIDALNASATAQNGGTATFYQLSVTQPGDRKFKDLNGDGKITDDDREALGSPIPDFFAGLNLDASYKAFDFSAFFYASVGNKIFNYAERSLENFGATQGGIGIQNVSEEYYLNRWTSTNPSDRFARANKADASGNTRPSDVYVEDGSYLRLRTVQLGYTLPVWLTKKASISRARLYFSAQNLFTITKYSGLDPEIGLPSNPGDGNRNVTANGIDVGTYPTSRFYTLGLNVTF